MAERIRLNLVLDYGVDYKTDSGIESDVRDALSTVGIHLHAMSRLQYKDGQAVIATEVYTPAGMDQTEADEAGQEAIDKFTLDFRRRTEQARKNHPGVRYAEPESAPEPAPESAESAELEHIDAVEAEKAEEESRDA